MKMLTFAKRCAKEILRDPINLGFGLGFPLVLLMLLSALQSNIPVSLFEINTLTPGITVFGLSFMTLFSATLIAKDRESALLQRLYTTPLTGFDFILGYMLPLLPISLGQTVICYLFAIPLGLEFGVNVDNPSDIGSKFLMISLIPESSDSNNFSHRFCISF